MVDVKTFSAAAFLVAIVALVSVSPASAQSANDGWKTTIYPIYLWAPLFGADVRLPERPSCSGCSDTVVPGGHVDSSFNGAAFFGARVDHRRFFAEADLLWAGMEASADRPVLKLKVSTVLGGARAGVAIAPHLYIDAGVRRFALDIRATALQFEEVQWKPGVWEPTLGAAYNPMLSKSVRLFLQGDYGGIGSDTHSTSTLTARIEWQPVAHFSLTGGYGYLRLSADGTLVNKPISLKQTLHGPIIGIGIPF
jgi:hypothetical protein